MSFYFDTSLLISIFTNETASERSRSWLVQHEAAPKAISWWVETELSAALSIKVRNGQINQQQRERIAAGVARLVEATFVVLEVNRNHFAEAARLAGVASSGLRAGDSLHLAIAGMKGMTVCTLDRRLADAGEALGRDTVLV